MSSSVDSAGGKPQRDSDANGWWNDPHHPPYDGSPDELEVWYGCTLSTLPEYGSIEFAHMLRYGVHPATAAIMAVGAAAGPVVQWRYARAAVVKPRRLLTALSCLPALCAGLTATGAVSPVMYYFDACRARQPPRVSLTARDELTDADKWLYCYQAVEVHRGERPWPLPLRATNPRQADQQTVPAWVDKPPPDFGSTWSEGRMEWKRRMAEEWGYTAEDVAVRDKVQSSAFWCNVLPYTHCLTAVVGGLGSVRRRSMRLAEAATACFSPRVQRSCLHSRCPIYAVVGFSVVRSEGASLVQRPARGPTRPRQQRLQTRVLRAPLLSPDEPSLALQRLVLLLPVPYNTWCTSMRYAIDSLAELVIRRAWGAERLTPLCCAQQNRCSCDLSCIPQRSRTTSSHHSLLCLSSLRLHCQAVAVPWETACSIRRLIVLTVVVSLTVRRVAPHESVEREDGGE